MQVYATPEVTDTEVTIVATPETEVTIVATPETEAIADVWEIADASATARYAVAKKMDVNGVEYVCVPRPAKASADWLDAAIKVGTEWYLPADFESVEIESIAPLSAEKIKTALEASAVEGKPTIKRGEIVAAHGDKVGAAIALAAHVTGKNKGGVLATLAAKEWDSLIAKDGNIEFFGAIRTVCHVWQHDYAFAYTVRQNGVQSAKREEWLKLREALELGTKLVGKTGNATATAKKAADALKLYDAINDKANAVRAAHFAKLTASKAQGQIK